MRGGGEGMGRKWVVERKTSKVRVDREWERGRKEGGGKEGEKLRV